MVHDVGEALDHAHSQGVVHRDVKPGNVLVRDDGVTKLADLGIATASDGTRITRSGTVLGTAGYMAPEQLDGRGAGPAADVYALAAISFEALSGKRPREGRTPVEIAHQIATEGAPDLNEVWPAAPKRVARVLQRGMALDPEDRPGSAGEFASELADALEDAPEKTRETRMAPAAPLPPRPTPPSATPGRGGSRPSTGAIVLVAIFIVLAVATIAGAVLSGGDDEGTSPPSADNTPAQPKQGEKKKKEPKAEKEPKEEPAAAAPAPTDEPGSFDEARGAELNQQGFVLMGDGRYDEAIPVLQQAVNSFPPDTGNLNYAYALFNLGKSLRLAGRPEEAIPVLERRLEIPNQTDAVQAELDRAKREAGEG